MIMANRPAVSPADVVAGEVKMEEEVEEVEPVEPVEPVEEVKEVVE